MTFRLRIFLLVVLVAATAIGATAWLTLSLASREVDRSQESARRHSADIVAQIARYGLLHGRWNGVDDLAQTLNGRTGLRIRLQTLYGLVLVDTDTIAGLRAGPVVPSPILVDPRPKIDPVLVERFGLTEETQPPGVPLSARTGPDPADAVPYLTRQLAEYRTGLRVIRCLRRENPTVPQVLDSDRMPYLSEARRDASPTCLGKARASSVELNERTIDAKGFAGCKSTIPCTNSIFDEFVAGVAAEPLELYFGVTDTDPLSLIGPTALAGGAGLGLVAIIGTALVARQVSRPVRRLTMASRLLAGGDFDARVPAHGGGELAQLSRSFNTMAQAVQHSEERQRRLVADVAHELRTPLSNLRGYLEALQDGVVQPSRELFVSLHDEALLQGRILDDLQVLALAELGSLVYTRTAVDLAELVETAGTAHRAVATEAGLRLVVDAPEPVWIDADQDRLRQVLGNLLTNAIRYTGAGGAVFVRATAANGGALLAVTDTGAGIADADLRHVFDRFWRADPARQRTTGGSGLGLTIAQRIVADHGGLIEVTSTLGVGTTFTVALPPELVVPPPFPR